MTDVELLGALCPQISQELQPHLKGIFGGIIRGYLPQIWVFRTESGSATLVVDPQGVAIAKPGTPVQYDVLVLWTDSQLGAALTTRDRTKVPSSPAPQISFGSSKGKTAFGFLRKRFGL